MNSVEIREYLGCTRSCVTQMAKANNWPVIDIGSGRRPRSFDITEEYLETVKNKLRPGRKYGYKGERTAPEKFKSTALMEVWNVKERQV